MFLQVRIISCTTATSATTIRTSNNSCTIFTSAIVTHFSTWLNILNLIQWSCSFTNSSSNNTNYTTDRLDRFGVDKYFSLNLKLRFCQRRRKKAGSVAPQTSEQRTLTVGRSVNIRLVSSLTSLDSSASPQILFLGQIRYC